MIVQIDSLVLGSGDYNLSDRVEGLDKPPIRTSSSNYSGRHGGRVNGQKYGPRLITLPGFIRSATCTEHDTARATLLDGLPIETDLDITVTLPSGSEFITSGRLIDLKMPHLSSTNPWRSDFKIDILCGDPNLYIGEEITLAIPLFVGGGFVLPFVLPVTFAAGTSPVTATNGGSVLVYPIITITGEAHTPVITKVDTGEKIEVGVTMTGGDVLVIDTRPDRRSITLNGGSVLGYLSSDSEWLSLDVGANRFIFETDDGGDTGTAEMTWRNAVEGA